MDILPAQQGLPVQQLRREAIMWLHKEIVDGGHDVGADSCKVFHHFAPGSYGRELHMPAGMIVIGKIHKHAHINVISKGYVVVVTEHDGVLEYTAPCTFVSKPGTKRVVLTLEDTVWTTMHVTDKTDLAEIEREVIAQDFTEVT